MLYEVITRWGRPLSLERPESYIEAINQEPFLGNYSMRATEYVPGSTNLIVLTNGVAYSNSVSGDFLTYAA